MPLPTMNPLESSNPNPDLVAVTIHGGAGRFNAARAEKKEPVLRQALDAAWRALVQGARAEFAMVEALSILEGSEHFNAGFGGYPNINGIVLLDVALMTGERDFTSLINVRRVKYPSRIAFDSLQKSRTLMSVWTHEMMQELDSAPVELKERYGWVATHNELLARPALEALKSSQNSEVSADDSSQEPGTGTIGCVLRDQWGRVAAGTSTGGVNLKANGRIGDSPVIGSGAYADNEIGAISTTGHGESILRSLMSGFILSRMRNEISEDRDVYMVDTSKLATSLKDELALACTKFSADQSVAIIVIPARGAPAFAFRAQMLAVALRAKSSTGEIYEQIGVLRNPEAKIVTSAPY